MACEVVAQRFDHHSLRRRNRTQQRKFVLVQRACVGVGEEAGFDAREFRLLHVFYPSTGMTDSTLHVYLARGLAEIARDGHGPEETHMEVFDIPLSEAVDMIVRGEIVDAKTTIGVLLTERLLRGN